jgi:hypothetical protein
MHLLMAVDKFSKWIKARPIIKVRSEEAVAFFTNTIYRFGITNTIIADNGTQFTGKKFLNFCDDMSPPRTTSFLLAQGVSTSHEETLPRLRQPTCSHE